MYDVNDIKTLPLPLQKQGILQQSENSLTEKPSTLAASMGETLRHEVSLGASGSAA